MGAIVLTVSLLVLIAPSLPVLGAFSMFGGFLMGAAGTTVATIGVGVGLKMLAIGAGLQGFGGALKNQAPAIDNMAAWFSPKK